MTAVVWFSHPPDYGKLALSVVRVRELDPLARLHVCIESSHDAPALEGIEVIRRDFNRGTHLDGAEAVHGVAQTLASIESDIVVKIDSDMILKRPFWLAGPTVWQRWNNFYVGLYALPRHILRIVVKCLEGQPSPGPHEAIAIAGRAVTASIARGEQINHIRMPHGVFIPEILT